MAHNAGPYWIWDLDDVLAAFGPRLFEAVNAATDGNFGVNYHPDREAAQKWYAYVPGDDFGTFGATVEDAALALVTVVAKRAAKSAAVTP